MCHTCPALPCVLRRDVAVVDPRTHEHSLQGDPWMAGSDLWEVRRGSEPQSELHPVPQAWLKEAGLSNSAMSVSDSFDMCYPARRRRQADGGYPA